MIAVKYRIPASTLSIVKNREKIRKDCAINQFELVILRSARNFVTILFIKQFIKS